MVDKKEIEHLAELSRIDLTEEEKESLEKDFEEILGFVQEVDKVQTAEFDKLENASVENVLREDEVTQESGEFSDDILENAPATENGFVKVKKIL